MTSEYEVTINQDTYYVTVEPFEALEQSNSEWLHLQSAPNSGIISTPEKAPWSTVPRPGYSPPYEADCGMLPNLESQDHP